MLFAEWHPGIKQSGLNQLGWERFRWYVDTAYGDSGSCLQLGVSSLSLLHREALFLLSVSYPFAQYARSNGVMLAAHHHTVYEKG